MKPPEPTDPTTTDPFERMLLDAGRAEAPRATRSMESLHTMQTAHTARQPPSRNVPTIPAVDGNVLKPGVWVDNFKILRLVGQGAMGAVYLARDKRLGRKVALKVVLPHLLGSKSNLARLGIEAQLTAKLNHPHVVTIYAVGKVAGGLYVALEYLEGQSLRTRLEQGELSMPDVLRYGSNIAEALAAAHEKGVLHRDLKPENVMLPNDGRLRVVDFGLAQHFDLDFELEDSVHSTAPASIGSLIDHKVDDSVLSSHGDGTPAYMAPEQWHSETNSTTTDIWALGVLLYEMAVDEHPFPCQTMETLYYAVCVDEPPVLPTAIPSGLRTLIGKCLSRSPTDRPTAKEVAEKLGDLNRTDTDAQPITENPFRGLTHFAERHSQLFFGRDEELAQFRERLRHAPVLPIVGASGVGKTSFVLAGICPSLEREKEWSIVHVRPGAQPFQALAWRLYHATQPQLRDSLGSLDHERAARGGTADALRVLEDAPSSDSTTQDTEEAASPVTNSSAMDTRTVDDAVQFVERLTKALRAERHCLSLTLRDMAEAANTKVLLVVDQLEELFTLCERPEDRERFVEALCVAADDRADPIRIVFTVRDDYLSRLTTSSVVQQALRTVTVLRKPDAAMLEEVLRGPVELMGYDFDDDDLAKEIVSTVEQEVSSLALLSFTARLLWEGRDEEAHVLTRTAYESFGGVAGAISTHADGVLDDCSAHELDLAHQLLLRLVTPDRRRRVVARPALLDGLPEAAASVLQRFVKARLVSSRKVRHGAKAEIQLELAHESLVKTWPTLARWVDESREQLDFLVEVQQGADLWLKRGRRHDELWLGNALQEALRWQQATTIQLAPHVETFIEASASRARYRQLRKRLALIFAAMALMFLAIFLHATNLRLAAQKRTVEKQRSTALTEGAGAAFQQGNYLEARAKLRLGVERLDSSAARALWWQLGDQHLVWKRQFGALLYAVDFSPDGSIIGATSLDHSVYLLDPVTRSTRVLRGHTDQVTALAFSPNSTELITGDWHGTVIVWEIRTGAIVKTFRAHEGGVMALAHWSNGTRWASASKDRKVRIWDTRSSKMLREFQHDAALHGLSVSPDGKLLAAGDHAGKVHLWDVDSGTRKARFSGHDRSVRDVAFSPNGKLIASASFDHTVRLWDVATRRAQRQLTGHRHGVHQVAFSPNGRTLVSAGFDRELLQWDVATGHVVQRITGHAHTIRAISFSPDGQYIASAGNDHTLRLWRMDAQPNSLGPQGHEAAVIGVVFSPDGKHVASASADGTAREWDVMSGQVTRVYRGHDAQVNAVAYSADGQRLATSSHDKTARLWSTASPRLIHLLGGHSGNVSALSFSPDDQYILTGSGSKVHLWNAETGHRDSVLDAGPTSVESIAFNTTGEQLVLASGRNAHTWQFQNAAPLTLLGPHQQGVLSAFFLPATDKVITMSSDRFVRVWDKNNGKELEKIGLTSRVYHGDAHPDGRRIAAASSDRKAYIIDMKSKKRLALRGHAGEVNHVRFSHDGSRVVTGSDDGTVRTWLTATGEPFWRGPALLADPPRLFSHRGWVLLDDDEPASMPTTKWRSRIETGARFAAAAADGEHLCVRTTDDFVEVWSMERDKRLSHEAVPDVKGVRATAKGCLTYGSTRQASALLLLYDGGHRKLATGDKTVTAIGDDPHELLVAAGASIHRFDLTGQSRGRVTVDVGVTAVARVSDSAIVVGYRDGSLELARTNKTKISYVAREPFESTPSSPVTILKAGPRDTVIAGFANGAVGLWTWHDGRSVIRHDIHGRVTHLLMDGERLYGASDLGAYFKWDLSPFLADWCGLLENVWASVPVIWKNGRAVATPPPAKHSCRQRRP